MKDIERYKHLNTYLKDKFGERTLKICVDGGFTCPNRDGTCGFGGCSFCGERGSGENTKHIDISKQVKNHLDSYSSYNTPFCDISSQITSFILGDSVQNIPAYLCCKMDKLTSVTIPNSVTSIGRYAFSGCTSLTSIAIPCNVTSVAQTSFDDCSSLLSVAWNAKISIDYNKSPFDSSKSTLKSITFGDSVKYIPE